MSFINKNSRYILLIIVLIFIVLGLYFVTSRKVESPVINNDLVSFSVKPGDEVSGILNLTGTVKNAYFFEGNILIKLLDSKQNIIKSGFGTATTDWMTAEPVSFTSSIDSTGLNGKGFILIQNDDPSDGEGGVAKKILIPVMFNKLPASY